MTLKDILGDPMGREEALAIIHADESAYETSAFGSAIGKKHKRI